VCAPTITGPAVQEVMNELRGILDKPVTAE
jgi:hypothetical protein